VLEIRGDLDFGQKALAAEDGRELGVQDLDRHLAAVLEILGEMDGGHAALAQLPHEAVAVGQRRRKAGGWAGHSGVSLMWVR
jgi:hypothetical protein